MVEAFQKGFVRLFKVQGLVSLLLIILADSITRRLGLGWVQVPLFRVDVVGVYFQLMVMCLFIGLFYLNELRLVLALSGLYLSSNFCLSLLSIHFGPAYYGFGFAASGLLTATVSLACINNRFRVLNYTTFVKQPIHEDPN